jgi:nitroreductase
MMNTTSELLNVRDAARQRRSIRAYGLEAIPTDDMREILEVTGLAPSAFNLQPWRFVVVETPEVKEKLAAAAYGQRQVSAAPAVIVLYTDMEDTLAHVDEVLHPGMDAVKRAAAREGVLKPFMAKTPAEREAWGAEQGHIALGFLLLAAQSHGYQTSTMAGFEPAAVKALLDLPENARVVALVAIGRGAEEGFPHHRHQVERIARAA